MNETALMVAISVALALAMIWRTKDGIKIRKLERDNRRLNVVTQALWHRANKASKDPVKVQGGYVAFCEVCPDFEIFNNADHARNNGWEIANGQQFCPEHRG